MPGAALTISNATAAATCPSNGTITVTGGGGVTPYEYRITAGPVTRAFQSSNAFASLPPGTYTVQLRDACSNTINANATVANSYTPMTLSRTFVNPTCNTPGNGTITTTVTGGSLPLSYRLLQGATVIAGPQASNVFNNLPSGSYIAEVTDQCGEIRTIATTLTYSNILINSLASDNNIVYAGGSSGGASPDPYFPTDPFIVSGAGPIMFTCDSVAFRFHDLLTSSSALRRVWVKELIPGTIIYDETFSLPYTSGPTCKLKIGVDYRIYVSDLCDNIDSTDRNYATQTSYSIGALATKMCAGNRLDLSWANDYNTKNRYSAPVDTITIISSTLPGDTLVGKQIIHKKVYTGGALTALNFNGVTVGQTYTIEVKNFCGTYTLVRLVSAPGALSGSSSVAVSGCKLNTASIIWGLNNVPVDAAKLYCRINSGPASFTDNYGTTYPITYPIYDSSTTINQITLGGLPVGTYSVDFWHNCGTDTLRKTFDVTSTQVHALTSSLTVVQGCSGSSTATLNTSFKQYTSVIINLYKKNAAGVYTIQSSSPFYQFNTIPSSYPFTGLLDGDYMMAVIPTPTRNQLFPMVCDTFFRQNFALQYQIPAFTSASKGFVCTPGGTDGKVELHTSKGVAPFTFQRLAIPANTVIISQTDSVFTGLSAGTHRFRITDACGNAVIQDFAIDTLVPNPIQISNPTGCVGQRVKLFSTSVYPGAAFSWSGPGGITSSADTLTLDPFTAANAGEYTLAQTIPGCSNPIVSKITLSSSCIPLPIELSSFTASVRNCIVTLNWKSEVEIDFDKYEVQYSKDGFSFSSIKTVAGTGDNSAYSYPVNGIQGLSFFRLKMIDKDGGVKYSSIIRMNNNCNSRTIDIYPNPARDYVNINLAGYQGIQQGKLFNNVGQLMQTKVLVNGTNTINTTTLATGVYNLVITNEQNESQAYKVIVNNK